MKEWLEIRPVQPEDEGDLKVLWSSDGARFWPFAFSWKEHWENPNHSARWWLVALTRVDNRVVGSVRGVTRGSHNVIHEIVVNESDRRTGVGADLLGAVMGIGPNPNISLKTNVENEASNAFYLRQGFELSGYSHTKRREIMFNWSRNSPRVLWDRPVHLEGMGLMGSLTALELASHSLPFTWSDPDFPAAWRASSGIVLPSGSPGHVKWLKAVREQEFPWAERGSYWSTQKNPGSAVPAADLGQLRLAKLPSVHVNVQQLVQDVRAAFLALNDAAPGQAPAVIKVSSHGFNQRLTSYLWGWTRLVKVKVSERIKEASTHRPAFNIVQNRFEKAYCVPLPGTELYIIGSSMISQKQPKEREIGPELDKCLKLLDPFADLFSVQDLVGETRQGWRPVQKGLDLDNATFEKEENRLLYPPMSHSGVSEGLDISERAVRELIWMNVTEETVA